MKRLNSDVSAAQRSLEQRPEVFHAVDVNLSANISLSLVNHIMHEPPLHPVIVGNRVVRVDRASKLDVLENFVLQRFPRHIRHNRSANLAEIAVKDSLHNRLASRGSHKSFLSGESHTPRPVHILDLPPNKGFIRFNLATAATDLRGVPPLLLLHNFADSLQHEPRRRLRHSQSAAKFVRTDSVL